MKTTAIAPWFGSNRTLGANVGRLLAGCKWVGVPFAGGMGELAHIGARTLLVSDLHRHVINLARVVKHHREWLTRELDATAFHPDALAEAQARCRAVEADEAFRPDGVAGEVAWAADYFVAAWMARNATAGTDGEFDAGMSVRWNAAGGDSAVRFRSAVASLADWQVVFRRCTFVRLDVFDFLAKVHDEAGHGVYLDPPFPGPGDKYKHKFDEAEQRRLAARLAAFGRCRVVCRYYDHSLVRELYPEPRWAWHHLAGGRKQSNAAAPEVLVVNKAASAAMEAA